MKSCTRASAVSLILLLIGGTLFNVGFSLQVAQARNEQIADTTNNNLMLSLTAPDNWNSGIISQSISDLGWRLNGLDAFNGDMSAFFVVVNSPSDTNIVLPLIQKSGILSIILSQYVTIKSQKDITLNDGSEAHLYSISITPEQLHRLNAPVNTGFDAILITTKQHDTTYIVAYASQLGRFSEFDSIFQDILNSVKFGTVGFSNINTNTKSDTIIENTQHITESDNASQHSIQTIPNIEVPFQNNSSSDSTMEENDNNAFTTNVTSGHQEPSTIISEVNKPTNNAINTSSSPKSAEISIIQGSSSPNMGKGFEPHSTTVSVGATVTWKNDDTALHTVTSGSAETGDSGKVFDSIYLPAGNTYQHKFEKVGIFDYYCTLHPFMKGKIVVKK